MASKRKKVLFITDGVIIFVVCALIIALLLNIQALKPRIEEAASDVLGMEVLIKGRLGIDLFPGIGISLREISVRNKGTDVITVEVMKVGLEFIALTRREIRINRTGLIKPVFSLVRYKNGTYNVEKPQRAPSERPLAVEKISISQGQFVYTDEMSGARIGVNDIEATLQDLSYSRTGGAKPFNNLSFDGDMKCGTFLINSINLKNLVMRAAVRNGVFDVNPFTMNIFSGKGTGRIQVDATGASPHYHAITTLSKFRIEEVVQAFSPGTPSQKNIEGPAEFFADLTASGKSADELKRSLNGDLSLNGEELVLTSIDIDALIPKYERSQNFNLVDVGAYFLAGPFGPVLTKSYNFASVYKESRVGKRSITKLVSTWNVKNGIAVAADAAFATKKYRIAMKGGLNFIDDRFVDVTVAVLDKRGCAVYSQKVHGPFRKPQVEKVNVFRSITGSVSNALEDAWKFIQREKCTIFYSGSVAQPGG